MSKRAFRLILAAYLAVETAASVYNAFFGVRVPGNIVRPLGQAARVGCGRVWRHLHCTIHMADYRTLFVLAECSSRLCCRAGCVCDHRTAQAFLHHFRLV